MIPEILQGTLSDASPELRREDWVPGGLTELSRLDPQGAIPLLKSILNERKFIFFKAWPALAREAAAKALKTGRKEGL